MKKTCIILLCCLVIASIPFNRVVAGGLKNFSELFVIDRTLSDDGQMGIVIGISEAAKSGLVVSLIVAKKNASGDFQIVSEVTMDHLSYDSRIIDGTLYILTKNRKCSTNNVGIIESYDISQIRESLPPPIDKLHLVDEIGYLFFHNGCIYHFGRNGVNPDSWCLCRVNIPELDIEKYYDSSFPDGEISEVVLVENVLSLIYEGGMIFMFDLLKEKEFVPIKDTCTKTA